MGPLGSHATGLSEIWNGSILWDYPMARLSTFKVGGPAEAVLVAEDLRDLTGVLQWLRNREITWRIIGKGSNLLVPDHGVSGVVIILGQKFAEITPTDLKATESTTITVGGACLLARLLAFCRSQGLGGLEFIVGIPGSVGGGIAMNAGAWGHELGEFIEQLTLLDHDGILHDVSRQDLTFSYRSCGNIKDAIVLSADFSLKRVNREELDKRCREFATARRQKQPQGHASAGSFFKNPPGQAAGRLIEQAGLKGHKRGGAMISNQHANFIVNTGNATARDILDLMEQAQKEVYKRTGITLEPEVHILK